jgi:RimJ/RimL family protein N-acetyltransferase
MISMGELGIPLPGWVVRPLPPGMPITGRCARIEKLDPVRRAHGLWNAVAGADHIWNFLPYGPFLDETAFAAWLAERALTVDPLCFAVIDRAGGGVQGLLSLMEIRPAAGVIEVGHILYAPALQRTIAATEAIYLAARLVFDDLGYRRFEWKCNDLNIASKRAAQRFGFSFEGVFRQHNVVKGRNRDTAWFAMLDGDWPARKAAFETWLRPENFDAAGRQRVALSTLNGAGPS